jgi:SAM-dependent methyltransferase
VSDAFFYDYLQSVGLDVDGIQVQSTDYDLSDYYDWLKSTVRDPLIRTAQARQHLAEASVQLTIAADQASKATQQITETIQQIAQGATQQARSFSGITTNAEQIARASDGIAGVPQALVRRYLNQCEDGWWVSADLRRQISFRQHDLLRDSFETTFDLIVCRNVTIYFTGEAREALYQRFHAALRPGGILFMGGAEIVSRSLNALYETIGVSFYRRK